MSKNIFILSHPLAGNYLHELRDEGSNAETFRKQAARLTHMLALEVTKDLKTKNKTCKTPMAETEEKVTNATIGIVPILRAGLGMVDPFLDFLPAASVLCVGLYRDEQTHDPVAYYNKLSDSTVPDILYVIDPMLATGGSAIMTIDALKEWGAKSIKFAGLIGAPEGVKALHEKHPDVDIHLAALDEKLNEKAYIVPGLGDAGDRIFNS